TTQKMVEIMLKQGVEVHRAKSEFTIGDKQYGAGSYVILLAQPYRANVKCLFEAQKYPDRRVYPGGPAEQPYDVAGWTLPMQMGVDYVAAGKRFDAELVKITGADLSFSDPLAFTDVWLKSPQMTLYKPDTSNEAYAAVNQLAAREDLAKKIS